MDRLVIEGALNDFQNIEVHEADDAKNIRVVLVYNNPNAVAVQNAFTALSSQSGGSLTMAIISTLVQGVYDVHLCCPTLDEPIKLQNKAISPQVINAIKSQMQKARELLLCTGINCSTAIEVTDVNFITPEGE